MTGKCYPSLHCMKLDAGGGAPLLSGHYRLLGRPIGLPPLIVVHAVKRVRVSWRRLLLPITA